MGLRITSRTLTSKVIFAVVITLWLFYRDEGYHNFQWMLDPGHWFVFIFYISLFTGCLLMLQFFILLILWLIKKLFST